MENVKEQAVAYAEGKFEFAVNKLIEKAYIDGYEAGHAEASKEALMHVNDDEWVDLGLPSGTLWSKDYLRDENGDIVYMTYDEAKHYNLPTFNQFEELRSECKQYKDTIFQGSNGNKIELEREGHFTYAYSPYDSYLWLNTEKPLDNSIWLNAFKTTSTFTGYRLPVRLVKAK